MENEMAIEKAFVDGLIVGSSGTILLSFAAASAAVGWLVVRDHVHHYLRTGSLRGHRIRKVGDRYAAEALVLGSGWLCLNDAGKTGPRLLDLCDYDRHRFTADTLEAAGERINARCDLFNATPVWEG